MTDVRLTATNPEDSSVVPVACNSRGELLVTEPVIEQIDNDVTINGDLAIVNKLHETTDITWRFFAPSTIEEGSEQLPNLTCYNPVVGNFVHELRTGGLYRSRRVDGENSKTTEIANGLNIIQAVAQDGEPPIYRVDWNGVVYSQNLVFELEEVNSTNYSEETGYTGPVLNVREELEFLRAQVRALMERLKMSPEGGWPVWDGSTET